MLNETALCGTVTNVQEAEMPELGDPDEHTTRAYYGLAITTEHGTATIDYRNDSNGYYGGYLLVRRDPRPEGTPA